MAISKHYYKNADITVIWQPGLCQHSRNCFRGLPEVFDPRKKPWIEVDKSNTQAIIDQVKKCPSGALSFVFNNELKEDL